MEKQEFRIPFRPIKSGFGASMVARNRQLKIMAGRAGVTVDELVARRKSGEQWCSGHAAFLPAGRFYKTSGRSCKECFVQSNTRDRRRAEGKCYDCEAPRVPGRGMCEEHRQIRYAVAAASKARKKSEAHAP